MKQIKNLTPHTLYIFKTAFGDTVDLPEEQEDVILVVSAITAKAAMSKTPNRKDIFVPGKQIRDSEGKIVGCEGIAVY